MNCTDFEELIALDVEGDLPERKAADLKGHLATCQCCQEFAKKLKASQALLKSLGRESPDEAALQQVCQHVRNRIAIEGESQRFPAWRFALGAALVATVIIAAVILWRPKTHQAPGSTREISEPAATEAVQPTPTAPEQPQIRTEKAKQVVRRRKRPPAPLTASVKPPRPQQVTVKLLTSDPNVVIYWVVD